MSVSISGEVDGYRYTVESHAIIPQPLEEGEAGSVTKVEFTNLRVTWEPEKCTTITTTIESGTITSVQMPDEDISDFEYTLSVTPESLDGHTRDDVARSILEGLGLGRF